MKSESQVLLVRRGFWWAYFPNLNVCVIYNDEVVFKLEGAETLQNNIYQVYTLTYDFAIKWEIES